MCMEDSLTMGKLKLPEINKNNPQSAGYAAREDALIKIGTETVEDIIRKHMKHEHWQDPAHSMPSAGTPVWAYVKDALGNERITMAAWFHSIHTWVEMASATGSTTLLNMKILHGVRMWKHMTRPLMPDGEVERVNATSGDTL